MSLAEFMLAEASKDDRRVTDLVRRHEPVPLEGGGERCILCHEAPWPCGQLREAGAVYADRPGYRPEWTP